MRPGHVVTGGMLVGAGALATLWLPFGLVGALALLALLRICWLEDNITSDLFGRDRLPAGYRFTAERRRLFLFRWFGVLPGESPAERSAHLMATAMRTEVQVWGVLLLGLSSTLVAQYAPFGVAANAAVGFGVFLLALTRADRLARSLAYCEAGEALPDHLLLPRRRRVLAERKR
ncbi:hypothetical protein [Roseicyclus persicicus]|uniref:Uncharacterized protein n=1 Tax=Roseicyclus persicicus TaxID=2650661 RepID=A0A7X6H219_9RHOB|nr:hypothetical protein [Roseibacterium persicicum]NKX46505.1 hypothetical protein [Roseibacterium persicicum]